MNRIIGVLTGGGDAPGLNAAIRAVVISGIKRGYEIRGIRMGWEGLIEQDSVLLDEGDVEGIHMLGGTMLGTSRTNPYESKDGVARAKNGFHKMGLEALVAIGGEDTLGVAQKLSREGLPCVGVPKTIDNDLSATNYCIGFDTAVSIASQAIEGLHTTARSHGRVLVCEVMGRHAGWLALHSGLAGGAHMILIPEIPFSIEEVADLVNARKSRGKLYSIIVVAEGAAPKEGKEVTQASENDAFGHARLGGIAKFLEKLLEERCSCEARSTVLGHIQRGGSPTAFDRFQATRVGAAAVDLLMRKAYGRMVSIQGTPGNDLTDVDLAEAVGKLKTVGPELYELAKRFFG